MTSLNNILWSLGLTLHLLLLITLVVRGMARRLPAFTGLMSFYLLRSLMLYALSGHLHGPAYAVGYNALSLMDLLLQILVAWELLGAVQAFRGMALVRRLALFSAAIVLSGALAWGISLAIHADSRTPVDRGVLFCSALMLAVATAAAGRGLHGPARRVLQGFCMLSLSGIVSQVERTLAAMHRNAPAFHRWSYAEAAVYLLVLLFWLLSLQAGAVRLRSGSRAKELALQP